MQEINSPNVAKALTKKTNPFFNALFQDDTSYIILL
jgi:hypothetical protein